MRVRIKPQRLTRGAGGDDEEAKGDLSMSPLVARCMRRCCHPKSATWHRKICTDKGAAALPIGESLARAGRYLF